MPFVDGSGESLFSSVDDGVDETGNENFDFSVDSAFDGLKVNPPGVELPLVGGDDLEGSGLKVLPAKLKTAGGAGGAGPLLVSC